MGGNRGEQKGKTVTNRCTANPLKGILHIYRRLTRKHTHTHIPKEYKRAYIIQVISVYINVDKGSMTNYKLLFLSRHVMSVFLKREVSPQPKLRSHEDHL